MSAVRAIGVVIPVHDEEELLAACLRSVQDAVAALDDDVAVSVVVVLDTCTDRSAEIAARFPFTIVEISDRLVGAARRAGVARVRAELSHVDAAELWLMATDADSVVAPHWIGRHVALARAGADVVVGTVRPDLAALHPDHVAEWHATHPPGIANGHVHGANLGIRASVYASAGGFAAVPEHEDVLLVDRARRTGAAIVATADCCVETSARLVGRTPGGYAAFLRQQAERFLSAAPTP